MDRDLQAFVPFLFFPKISLISQIIVLPLSTFDDRKHVCSVSATNVQYISLGIPTIYATWRSKVCPMDFTGFLDCILQDLTNYILINQI